MTTVSVYQARTRLSDLLRRVQAEDEIVIARAGRPVARLVPATAALEPRRPGSGKGDFIVSEDFDAPLPAEMLKEFEGPLEP